jgi:hypothetical protein
MSESSDHNSSSARPLRSPRKRIAIAAPVIAWSARQINRPSGRKNRKHQLQKSAKRLENERALEAHFNRARTAAYRKAGLDEGNPQHKSLLLTWLCWSIYGAKAAGQPRRWSTESHGLLLSDLASLRQRRPDLSDEQKLCNALVSGRDSLDRYKRFKNGSSLRRRLQIAKAQLKRRLPEKAQ